MATVIGHWQIRGYGFFSVESKDSGEWVGRVGPWFPEGWPEPEVGWTIAPEHWGKGFATEAGRASIEFAFRDEILGQFRESYELLESQEELGSRFERRQSGLAGVTDQDVLIYAQPAP